MAKKERERERGRMIKRTIKEKSERMKDQGNTIENTE